MIERELKLLIDAQAIKRVQIHYAVMSQGYMVIADGKALETGKIPHLGAGAIATDACGDLVASLI